MSSEAEQKFQNFDFSTNVAWKEFEQNIFPVPSSDKLEKIKRKWFKKKIDSSLEDPSSSTPSSHDNTTADTSQTSESTSSQSQSRSDSFPVKIILKIVNTIGGPVGKLFDIIHAAALPMKEKIYSIEGILKFVFIITAFVAPVMANSIAFVVCLFAYLRQTGRPRWDISYGKKAMGNEFLQNLLYMVPFAFFPSQKTLVYYLPLAIHFWIGFCEFVNLKLPSLYPKIAKVADFTRQNRTLLMLQKAKLEIMLFVFLVILLFFRGSNLLILFFYGNFLKTKYLINPQTKAAFQEMNAWVEGKISSPYCPGIIKLGVSKVRAFCEYLVKSK